MNKPIHRLAELSFKYLQHTLDAAEAIELEGFINQSEANRQFFNKLTDQDRINEDLGHLYKMDRDAVWETVVKKLQALGWDTRTDSQPKVAQMKWWRYVAAAVIVLFTSAGLYFLAKPDKPIPKSPVAGSAIQSDATPSTSQAYLELDNGKRISLDSLNVGLLATQGNTKVVRQENGGLNYSASGNVPGKVLYNKVTVPKGSDVVYLQLTDQSKVWLNAGSSIRYPVEFSEEERNVEITGEAYFEVASIRLSSRQKKSFIVSKGNMNVVVLGTKFNVNSYENEGNIKVTLLEGSVKVQSDKSEKTIQPGQQAVLTEASINVLNDVDLEQVMAWREGKFVFNDTDLEVIMRQIERWYDVDVKYERDVRQQGITLTGRISRYSNASKVLELLQATGLLHFTIEGKRITVKSSAL